MARLRRGEVRWYKFTRPDKKRPVVVLTRDSALDFLGEVTVAPVTSTVRDIPSEVLLTPADGMARECAVNLDHVQTVPKGNLGSLITTLSREKLARVGEALSFALEIQGQAGSRRFPHRSGSSSSRHPGMVRLTLARR